MPVVRVLSTASVGLQCKMTGCASLSIDRLPCASLQLLPVRDRMGLEAEGPEALRSCPTFERGLQLVGQRREAMDPNNVQAAIAVPHLNLTKLWYLHS